jgi:hypothetical protein
MVRMVLLQFVISHFPNAVRSPNEVCALISITALSVVMVGQLARCDLKRGVADVSRTERESGAYLGLLTGLLGRCSPQGSGECWRFPQ